MDRKSAWKPLHKLGKDDKNSAEKPPGLAPPVSVWQQRPRASVPSVIHEEGEDTLLFRSLASSLQYQDNNNQNQNNSQDVILTEAEYNQVYASQRLRSKSLFGDDPIWQSPKKDVYLHPHNQTGQSGRRHSLAAYDEGNLLNTFADLALKTPQNATEQKETIDSYFENTSARRKSWIKAGKNLLSSQLAPVEPEPPHQEATWPLYVVEFKAGRTDYFFAADSQPLKVGDICIVEADRGKDLGKIIHEGISCAEELEHYQLTHPDSLVDSHNAAGKEVHPKRIFRPAHSSEISLLISKSQDETKSATVCQLKIRQRKLAMEVVDAEYQWDRRKLTFYFVADERIDFRELVRELFKIYKTRIWM
jgi:hypothetical protein